MFKTRRCVWKHIHQSTGQSGRQFITKKLKLRFNYSSDD